MARAGEEDLELHYTAKFRTHPPPQTAGTVYFAVDVGDVPAVMGSQPDRLAGHRSAQDLVAIPPYTQIPEDIAKGGTVGGSAAGPCRTVWVRRADR